MEINDATHREMQWMGLANENEYRARVLAARQEIIGEDRQWAGPYEPGQSCDPPWPQMMRQ